MRDYGRVSPRFWTGDTGRKLRGKPNLQIVLMYLVTSPGANMIGLYYLPLPIVAHETGVSSGEVAMALRHLREIGVAYYDADQEIVYIPAMAKYQIGETIPRSNLNMIKGINRELDRFEKHPFGQDFIARYGIVFCLGRGLEGASEGLDSTRSAPSEGDKVGDLFTTRPLRDQDQETAQEQEQETARATGAPARSNPPAKLWTAGDWLKRYGSAWVEHYGQLAYGQPGDSRACGPLADVLAALPEQERLAAQEKAPEMFAEFLSRGDPKTVERRHPFSFFVQEWGGLRVPKLRIETPAGRSRTDGNIDALAAWGKRKEMAG